MKNSSKLYTFLGLVALVAGIIFWVYNHPPQAFAQESADTSDELSERNIVRIQVDSLSRIMKEVYGNDVTITHPEDELLLVKVQHQGNEISNFYNDNPRLLETRDERFSIKRTGSGVEATFKVEVINGDKYAFVPTDVVYKLTELAYNK